MATSRGKRTKRLPPAKRGPFPSNGYTARQAVNQTQFLLAQRRGHAFVAALGGLVPADWSTFTAAQRRGYLSGFAQAFDDFSLGAHATDA